MGRTTTSAGPVVLVRVHSNEEKKRKQKQRNYRSLSRTITTIDQAGRLLDSAWIVYLLAFLASLLILSVSPFFYFVVVQFTLLGL